MIEKYGCWTVGDKKFLKKYDALLHATTNGGKVKFYYHDDVWNNFDRTQLGKQSLDSLYKQRAQQLRDTYDYIIIYFSGGADSNNALYSFIDNNIKVDEVCVKWPKPLQDGKFYTPNIMDQSSRNYWSEWNYSIKPALLKLQSTHPEIKITIRDYTEDIHNVDIDLKCENLNFIRPGGIIVNSVVSDSETELLKHGKSVGHIYGVDKPLLVLWEKKIYMIFNDQCIDQAGRSEHSPFGTECFYWTPDFPLLPYEQAYQLSQYYKKNVDTQKYLWENKVYSSEEKSNINQFQNNLSRALMYTNWDNRFQADKQTSVDRRDKFSWIYEVDELDRYRQQYFHNLKHRVSLVDDRFLQRSSDNAIPVFKDIYSNYFYVDDL
jgi:hypothetical protein